MTQQTGDCVQLHELLHTLQTAVGTRPRIDLSGGFVGVPIRLALYRPGDPAPYAVLDAAGWEFVPYRAAIKDGKTGEVLHPEQQAGLFLKAFTT